MATKIIILATFFIFLTSCAIAPGMHVEVETPKEGEDGVFIKNEEQDFILIPLTAEIIQEQYAQKVKATLEGEEVVVLSGKNIKKTINPIKKPDYEKQNKDYRYLIGPQDILSIIVWEHPELTIPAGEYRGADATGRIVAPDGTIFFPYINRFKVEGKTAEEVREIVTKKLARYIENPQVDVRVVSFRHKKVYVTGAVAQRTRLSITDDPLRVLDAINAVGGPTAEADLENVLLMRKGKIIHIDMLEIYEKGNMDGNYLLEDEDILHVMDNSDNRIFIMGEVNTPSIQYLHKGTLSLASALQQAGGIRQSSAEADKIYVIRATLEKPLVYHVKTNSPQALLLTTQFELQPLDVVFVSTADIVRLNKTISNIIPIVRAPFTVENLVSNTGN